jgi:predicted ATPase/predicted Ser/Thr protein kinase
MIGERLARYEVLEPLGEGGMGLVYKARDTNLDRLVAVKILRPQTADAGRIRRFAQEARAASALNHPNIVTVYEIDKVPEGPDFIAMELVEGRTLHALAAEAVPISSLISIARQVAEALAVAHARGIIHRDIKPENIMVRRDGYVKVLDFGLSRLLGDNAGSMDTITHDTAAGTVAGTPAYMSPEQAQGGPLSNATDIFSLGLVLYELATGRHPYPGHSTVAVLQAIALQAAVPPSRLRPEIPKSLEELILAMMDKDPGRRPSAHAVVAALAEPERKQITALPSTTRALPSRRTVGRARELAQLHTCFEAASFGSGAFLCVTGEPGIGKTTLIEEFLAELSDAAPCVARGRCSERLAGTEAYLPILEALEDLVRTPMGAQWAHLLKLFAPTWYVQVALSSNDSSDQLRAEAQGSSQERMKREILLFFQEVARIRPLVLFFDDLHWADLSTVDILAYLGDRCRSLRLLIVTTYRPSDLLLSQNAFHQVQLELKSRGACREISVGFLGAAEIERYLAFTFPGHRFPAGFSSLIHSQTEGNPLFMVDLLRYLHDRSVLVEAPEGGRWTLTQSMRDVAIGLPESVRSVIQRKIERLDDQNRRLLAGACIQGYEFDSAVIATALQMDAAEVEERLDVLDRIHGLVRQLREDAFPDGTPSVRYQFVHVLYQNALYDSIRPTRRAALSSAVALALVNLYGDKSTTVASHLAFLFEAARAPSRAIDFYLAASRQAARVSANQEAVKLARRGLELIKELRDGAERLQKELPLLVLLATVLTALKGQTDAEVESVCTRAFELCRDSEDRAEIFPSLTGIGAFSFMRPDLPRALEVIHRLTKLAESSPYATTRSWVHFVAGSVKSHMGDLVAALGHEEAAMRAYNPSDHIDYLLQFGIDPGIACHSQAGRIAWIIGLPDRARGSVDHALAMARRYPHAYTLCFVLYMGAIVAQYRRDTSRCLELAAELHALALENAFPMFQGWGDPLYGWAIAETGDLEGGIRQIEEGLNVNRHIGTGLMRPEHMGLLAALYARNGDAARAQSTLEEAVDTSNGSGEVYCLPELLRLKADLIVQHSPGGKNDVEALLWRSLGLARQLGARSFELRTAMSLAECLRNRASEEARGLLSEVYGRFTEGLDTPDLLDAARLLSTPAG